jgi:hypothetical protein
VQVDAVVVRTSSWPSHSAMVAVSVPWRSKFIAQVWRSVWGVTSLPASDGHPTAAAATWRSTRRRTASRGNSGSPAAPRRSPSQARRTALVSFRSGVIRSLRPFPVQRTLAPVPRCTAAQASPVSSLTRRPVSRASSNRAWSRRPVRVDRSGAASSAATAKWNGDRMAVSLALRVRTLAPRSVSSGGASQSSSSSLAAKICESTHDYALTQRPLFGIL